MSTVTKAELLLASKNIATGDILFTWRLTFPRCILAEVNTHRVASRNTSSSRAIPSKKMRAAVLNDPYIPVSLGANQRGMQAGAELDGWRRMAVLGVLRSSRYPAVFSSWLLDKLGAHKQVSNRLLEPHSWCTQIFTATDVKNLFALRNHSAAEPHFHILAAQMQEQVRSAQSWFLWASPLAGTSRSSIAGTRQFLKPGDWHIPLDLGKDFNGSTEERIRVSAARCARTSYTLLDTGEFPTINKDLELCDRLIASGHLSPTEHQAQAMEESVYCGNFKGFKQFRKTLVGESGNE